MERQGSISQRIEKLNNSMPKADLILFAVQICCVCFIIVFCLFALVLEYGQQNLWVALLTTAIGYIMPGAGVKVSNFDRKTIKGGDNMQTRNHAVNIESE